MNCFIELTDFDGQKIILNINKFYELTAIKDGGTKITLSIINKKGWSVWVKEDLDEVMKIIK